MNGYYELKKNASGEYMFNLRAENHEIILTSQGYGAKQAAEKGIESVRENGVAAASFEKKISSDGQPFFDLIARNGEVIGTSEMYSSEAARDKGIEAVMTNCATAKIVEA